MARLSYEQLNIIKQKLGVKQLWSFSKASTYTQCSWLYLMKYIQKIRENGENCYTWFGTVAHDLIQGLYEGEHTYGEMLTKFEDKVLEFNMLDNPKLKFPSDNEYANYLANLRHYFANVEQLPYKVVNEKPVLAVFEGDERYAFQGYIDSEYLDTETGKYVILDYKTSSISGFTGKKLLEKARQLMIYASGLTMFGREVNGKMRSLSIEDIVIRYDMMKYLNVTYMQKNGTPKTTKAERRLWVGKIATPLRKDLEEAPKKMEAIEKEIRKLERKHDAKVRTEEERVELRKEIVKLEEEHSKWVEHLYDPVEIGEMIEQAIENNNLDNMPDYVKNKYTLSDCYIDVEITEEILEDFRKELIDILNEVTAKSAEEDKEQAFMRGRIENSETYYCQNLCELRNKCKFFKEYKANQSMFLDKTEAPSDADILSMLGL
ncbi:PD-(D/E)XK nuclease family protein [Priestia megaterium]|uniref:PD-(D/E)XK nuclease family protein n=1 Tax=Priestia megaterium TaxID=1404 RepID=UPI002E1BCB44|nr:PD-(D/E)XK nuclease family protein [Priestia megaterium]